MAEMSSVFWYVGQRVKEFPKQNKIIKPTDMPQRLNYWTIILNDNFQALVTAFRLCGVSHVLSLIPFLMWMHICVWCPEMLWLPIHDVFLPLCSWDKFCSRSTLTWIKPILKMNEWMKQYFFKMSSLKMKEQQFGPHKFKWIKTFTILMMILFGKHHISIVWHAQ